jgi:hypothetical protein
VTFLLPILAPRPPTPSAAPTPSPAPTPPSAPIFDPQKLARGLAKMLRDSKTRNEVLGLVQALSQKHRAQLEGVLVDTLSNSKDRAQGIELRRIIQFVRFTPGTPSTKTFTGEGGTPAKVKETKVTTGGTVTLRTGVHLDLRPDSNTNTNDAYSLTYDGPDAADMRWLQFIWREVVQVYPAKGRSAPVKVPVKMQLDNPEPKIPYFLTTDPKSATDSAKRRWEVDSPSTDSPFYEERSPVKRKATSLTMFDAPSAMPSPQLAAQLFNAASPPEKLIATFHAETYLVGGMEVFYRAKIDITWEIGKDLKEPPAAPKMDGAQRACLAIQYPAADFLPGPPIGAPLPADPFDPIGDLALADWPKHKNDLERFEDVAKVARAKLIWDVRAIGSNTIPHTRPVKGGLNYQANLTDPGQTGFVDPTDATTAAVFHNPEMPVARQGPRPLVAMILGGKAFTVGTTQVREKLFPVAVMRHEMTHATHNELAIGWLLAWRDAFTKRFFWNWLSEQHKHNRISDVDLAVISTGLTTPTDRVPTELLAWTEGFVTAMPFPLPTPEFGIMQTTDTWPTALIELQMAGDFYGKLRGITPNSRDVKIKEAALARIRKVSCGSLTDNQRVSLKNWINFVRDPSTSGPKTDADKKAVKKVNELFSSQTDWLKSVLKQVMTKCPK